MPGPRLRLDRPARLPGAEVFAGTRPVAWLGEPRAELDGLKAELEAAGRLWTEELHAIAVPGPPATGNPFSFRPDLQAPLRWGDPALDRRSLDELPGSPERFGGLVLVDLLGRLASQPARTLIAQLAERLDEGAPWILVERNGRYLPEVARNLRRDEAERGEGRETVRTAEELRRLVEPVGLGLEAAHALPGSGAKRRLLQRALGGDGGAAWLVLRGRRA